MAKRRLCLLERIENRRQKGLSPAEIALYAYSYSRGRPDNVHSDLLLQEERKELEKLADEIAERKAKKAADAAGAEARQAVLQALLPPPLPNLGREGLSPEEVRLILPCSATELDRWAEDGRLAPDGVRHYHFSNAGIGGRWGRAWLPKTIENAKARVNEWRAQDEKRERWISERALFKLVRSRFPDAERFWQPPWLLPQHVDIFIPSINVAIEYQGKQHYQPVSIFGGEDGFRLTQVRDDHKRELLATHGVTLIEWHYSTPIIEAKLDRALASVKGCDDLAGMRR